MRKKARFVCPDDGIRLEMLEEMKYIVVVKI